MSNAIKLILDGDNAWPDLATRRHDLIHLGDGTSIDLTVLPGAMRSGHPSVALRLDLPDGKTVIAETSWRLLAATCRAIAARYGWPIDDPRGAPPPLTDPDGPDRNGAADAAGNVHTDADPGL